MISSTQIRAARAMLRWSGQDLADRSGISLKTLRRYEAEHGVPNGNTRILLNLQQLFEQAGIEFTGDPLINPGVTLKFSDSAQLD